MGFVDDFKKFALRGNVIDLVVGFTVGAAFTTIVRSLVDDVITPVIGLAIGGLDFTNYFVILKEKAGAAPLPAAATLEQAREAGAVTINYGVFISQLITFCIVALVMFFLIRGINRLDARMEARFGAAGPKTPEEPSQKKCPWCLTTIPYQARRCPQCTSHLEEAVPAEGAETE